MNLNTRHAYAHIGGAVRCGRSLALKASAFRLSLLVALGGVVVATVTIVCIGVVEKASGNAVAAVEKVSSHDDGAFRPSDTQWSSLRLAPVRQVSFRDERVTDGKIAINDATPVFSPFSGRVSKLIARPGDFVERGAPLAAPRSRRCPSQLIAHHQVAKCLEVTEDRRPAVAPIQHRGEAAPKVLLPAG
jgi:biotin carboxyl carrier protein